MYTFYLKYLEIYFQVFHILGIILNCIIFFLLLSFFVIYFTNLFSYNWSTKNHTYLKHIIWSVFDLYMYPWNYYYSQIVNVSITELLYYMSLKHSILLYRLYLSCLFFVLFFFFLLLFLVRLVFLNNSILSPLYTSYTLLFHFSM